MTTLDVVAEKPPIKMDKDGVFRVGGTRVRLETVITAFQMGRTPDQIFDSYPAITLSDIYAVISYYLQHKEDVDPYLARRKMEQDESERRIRARFPSDGIMDKLLARRASKP